MKYICLACDHNFRKNVDLAYQVCPKCGGDAWWEDSAYIKGTFNTPVVPSWRRYEKAMMTGDGHSQVRASEKFTAERDHQLKTDPQMARWEKSRKEHYRKQKKYWVKDEKARLAEKGL